MKLILILIITTASFTANAQIDTTQIKSFDNYYPETKLRVIGKSINGILVDTVRLFDKSGGVMDSIIYQNGQEIYRARIDKKGKIKFEYKL